MGTEWVPLAMGGEEIPLNAAWVPFGKLVVRQLVRPKTHANVLSQLVFHPDRKRPDLCITLADMTNFAIRATAPASEFTTTAMGTVNHTF